MISPAARTRNSPSFHADDRVMPKDNLALWRDSAVVLTVVRCFPCETPEFRGRELVEIWVQWPGKKSFKVSQFASDYQRFQYQPAQPSRFSQLKGAR